MGHWVLGAGRARSHFERASPRPFPTLQKCLMFLLLTPPLWSPPLLVPVGPAWLSVLGLVGGRGGSWELLLCLGE